MAIKGVPLGNVPEKVYLSLGSNRGRREELLSRSCAMIRGRLGGRLESSSLYESEPWGLEDATSFYNLAAACKTALSPVEVLKEIHEIETCLGRHPRPLKGGRHAHDGKRIYEARAIDIDILFYGSKVIFGENLMIPHPHLAERRFVLVPMAEIAPDFTHPVLKKTIAELLAACRDRGGVRRLTPRYS